MNDDEFAAFLETGQAPDRPAGAGPSAVRDEAAGRVRRQLATESTWADPAPGGADTLLAAIRAEQGGPPVGHEAAPRGRGRRPVMVAAAAAVLVLVAVVATVAVVGRSDRTAEPEFAVTGTELAPDASGRVTTHDLTAGVAIELYVHDLAPAEPGTYYQGWVGGDDGLVTVGTFHMRGGDGLVELWSGVDLANHPTLTVTVQEEGAGTESSGQVVLSGRIVP